MQRRCGYSWSVVFPLSVIVEALFGLEKFQNPPPGLIRAKEGGSTGGPGQRSAGPVRVMRFGVAFSWPTGPFVYIIKHPLLSHRFLFPAPYNMRPGASGKETPEPQRRRPTQRKKKVSQNESKLPKGKRDSLCFLQFTKFMVFLAILNAKCRKRHPGARKTTQPPPPIFHHKEEAPRGTMPRHAGLMFLPIASFPSSQAIGH